MPIFTDLVLNPQTGKYEFQYVNQQYDFLMCVSLNEKTGEYEFNCSEEEAKQIAASYHREFDLKEWLQEGKTAIEEKIKTSKTGGPKTDD